MTPEQMMGMIRAGHDVEHVLDIKSADDEIAFRAFLTEEAKTNPRAIDALAQWERVTADLKSGVYGARSTWHSISPAQRHALIFAAERNGILTRCGPSYFVRGHDWPIRSIRVATLRNLCSRELMAWDGTYNDPESAATITERGRFVLAKGQSDA